MRLNMDGTSLAISDVYPNDANIAAVMEVSNSFANARMYSFSSGETLMWMCCVLFFMATSYQIGVDKSSAI